MGKGTSQVGKGTSQVGKGTSHVSKGTSMRGKVWLQFQILGGRHSGMLEYTIRLASWINHVTSHVLTMVTYISKHERWRALKTLGSFSVGRWGASCFGLRS